VRLKWGATEYHGRLISVDAYMNIQLHGTEEYVNGKSTGTLGQVLIRCVSVPLRFRPPLELIRTRCNNVLWISGKGDKKEVEMSG
jgi:LSM domain